MPDLLAERVKAFSLLRRELQQLGEPTGLDAYRKKLEIQADVQKDALLDAESMMGRLKMQAALSEQKYRTLLGYEGAKLEMVQEAEQKRQATELASPEMQEMAALSLAELPQFESKAGMLGLRDVKPGQELRILGLGKKFKPEKIFETASPQITQIMAKKNQLEKIEKQGLGTDGILKSSLTTLVNELQTDLNDPFVKKEMQEKGTEQELSLYNRYLDIVNQASNYLNK